MNNITEKGYVELVDDKGFLLSTNTVNLTKNGAKYLGKKSLLNSAYSKILNNYN